MDQSQLTQPGVTQREGKQLQESHPGINQSQQQIHRVSESLQLCEVDKSSWVGCGEPGISVKRSNVMITEGSYKLAMGPCAIMEKQVRNGN